MNIVTPSKIDLAHTPTPIRLLSNLSKEFGQTRIWLKSDDQTGSVLSGNKVRKLEFLLADAASQSATTIITCGGLQSNHCRATAMACARLGLKCHLILRTGDIPNDQHQMDGNWFLDDLCGATITLVDGVKYHSELKRIVSRLHDQIADQGGRGYFIPTGGSNGVGLWGYLGAYREMTHQFHSLDIQPQTIVCATGSAGTQGGLSLGCYFDQSPLDILGMAVCDSEAYFHKKILEDVRDWTAQSDYPIDLSKFAETIQTCDGYIGPGYGKGYEAVYETIKKVARLEGVVLDPVYTGKAFWGMLEEIRHGRLKGQRDVVFVHTGGIFGVFPQKQFLI